MREHQVPQFTLDTHRPVAAFDVLGVSFATELGYTNMLNVLDLAGLPLHARDRREDDPIVLAGGHAAFNPEPIADFIDAAVLGDGEEIALKISEVIQEWKAEGRPGRPGWSAAAAGRRRRGLRAEVLRRGLPAGRRDPADRPQPAGRAVPGGQAHPDGPGRLAVPEEAAGADGRDGARALLGGDLPRLHPRLPVLPGRHDHPAGPRAQHRDHRRHGAGRDRRHRAGGGRSAQPVQRRSLRDRRSPTSSRTATRARMSRSRCPAPGWTRSTSTWPTSCPATAGGPA